MTTPAASAVAVSHWIGKRQRASWPSTRTRAASPATGLFKRHRDITFRYTPEANAVFFIVDSVEAPIGGAEAEGEADSGAETKFLAELKGVRGSEADRRIDDWLVRLSLKTPEKDWGLAKIDELSRGMQQKVQFIGTLLHDPDLVILDEPFSGLDPINAQALKDTVVKLKHRGKTVIFSTHLMDNAERLCDSVCIIARGEKVLDGTVTDVKEQHGQRNIALALEGDGMAGVANILRDQSLVKRADDSNRFFEIEMAPGADPQMLLRRIVDSGASIQRFEMIQPSLHQIFLQKVGASGVEEGMTGHG